MIAIFYIHILGARGSPVTTGSIPTPDNDVLTANRADQNNGRTELREFFICSNLPENL